MKIEGYICHYGDYYKTHVTPHFSSPQYNINKGAFMKGIGACEKVPVFWTDKRDVQLENMVGHATLFQRKDGIYCEIETNETFHYKDALNNMQLALYAVRVEKDESGNINDGTIRAIYFTPYGYERILSVKE